MGTKVQCKSYFPGYYVMRDLNEDADSSWSRYYEDDTFSGHLYNGFALSPVNGFSGNDREMLKRTMLEHEAVFRKQVYELHRLYRIQKNLMDDFQKKGFYRNSTPTDTSLSNSFSSRMPSEGTKRMWQMPRMTVGSTSYNVVPSSNTDDMRPPLDFFEGSCVQSGRFPTQNGTPVKDGDLYESRLKTIPGRSLDLQLPADIFIGNDDSERKEGENVVESSFRSAIPSNKIYSSNTESGVKLTLGTGDGFSLHEDGCKSDSHKQNCRSTHSSSDLNDPTVSESTHFLGPKSLHDGDHWRQLPIRSNTWMHNSLFKEKHINEGSCSRFLNSDKGEVRWDWPFFNNEAGESRSSASLFSSLPLNEKLPMASESEQRKPAKNQEILSPTNLDSWFRRKPTSDNGISNNLGFTSFSASKEPVNGRSQPLVAVQALPCFDRSTAMNAQSKRLGTSVSNPSGGDAIWQENYDLRPQLKRGCEILSYANGFHHQFQMGSDSAFFGKSSLDNKGDSSLAFGYSEGHGTQKRLKGLLHYSVNLNQEPLGLIRDGPSCRQDVGMSSGEIPWLTGAPTSNGSVDLNHRASQMEFDFSQGRARLKSREAREKGQPKCNLQEFPSTLQAESTIQANESFDGLSGKKIFGFRIPDKIPQNVKCFSSNQKESQTDTSVSERVNNHINLNSTLVDDPIGVALEVEAEVPPRPSEVDSKIDLERPIPPPEELNKAEEELIVKAAENIIRMSINTSLGFDDITRPPSPSSQFVTLQWFAEVVSKECNGGSKASDEGLDLFELMTLALEETKPDDNWCMPPDTQKDEETGDASLLLTRPRRGQRRRRQRRDFQRDILPGLASLSRHEVTEDLQTIGGLMRASGVTWQAGLTRRNRGRGRRAQARGRQLACQPVEPHVTTEEAEFKAEERSMIGWGRTTRRCRRQRWPLANANAAAPSNLKA